MKLQVVSVTLPPTFRELDTFELMFCKEAATICIEQTNLYADQTGNAATKRYGRWEEVKYEDILKFFAIRILMGITRKPEMKHYWSKDPMLQMPIIPKIMSNDRYMDIQRFIHFSDNEEQNDDRLRKIRTIWELVMSNFRTLLQPGKCLSVDETLVLHKGRLHFRQYIPNKASKFGIKTFSIVDEGTKMILNSFIYSGKTQDLNFCRKEYGYGGAIVLHLMNPYFEKFHHVYCDNWFSSPNLAQELMRRKTYLCATLRKNRKNTDPPKKMKKGEVIVKSANGIMTQYWKDKKMVSIISTIHDHQMQEVTLRGTGAKVLKPTSVLDYNKYARGIDQGDMVMSTYNIRRKTKKWPTKMFLHLIDICLYNAHRIFVIKTRSTLTFLEFRLQITRQILQKYGLKDKVVPSASTDLERLTGRIHFPSFNPPTKKKLHGSRKCKVCASKKEAKDTVYQCNTCIIPLCAVPCFE